MTAPFSLHAGGRRQSPFVTWVRPRSDQLFFLFQGYRPDLTQDKPTFIRDSGLVERNFVVLRDRSRRRYQFGISDELPSIPAVVRWQREYAAGLSHVRRLFCLGTSYGAYAALVCGHLLGVETVWAFAPQTFLYGSRSGLEDVAKLLSKTNGRTEYRVYYCEASRNDKLHAQRIAHCPGVTLFARGAGGHDVLAAFSADGAIAEALGIPGP
jgi:hypothetical protein